MKILMFSGSLRKDSLNKKLLLAAEKVLKNNSKVQITFIDLKTFNLPVYDGDLEINGLPENVNRFANLIADHQALILSTPEYNSSISGVLKNAIDWASRAKPNPLSGKAVLLMGASPGAFGAVKGLTHSRVPFEALGNFVFPITFGLPKAHEAFAESGELKDAETQKKLVSLLENYLDFSFKLKGN